MTNVGTILRELRVLKGKTQMEVFHDTLIHNKTLSGYENNVSEPDFETLKILAAYYETTTDYIIGKINNKIAPNSESEANRPKDLLKFLEQSEVMFDGETYNLDEEDKKTLRDALEYAFWHAKQKNKRVKK